jgi:hypothetical protein
MSTGYTFKSSLQNSHQLSQYLPRVAHHHSFFMELGEKDADLNTLRKDSKKWSNKDSKN